MRAAVAAVVLPLALAGCSNKPDPDWSKPCAEQRPPSVEVGTGTTSFGAIGAGIPIEVDTTGAYVWMAVSVQGFGPDVTVNGTIEDVKSGAVVATLAGTERSLTYDSSADRDVAAGLELRISPTLDAPFAIESLAGEAVDVSTQITGCGRTGSGHDKTLISGFDTSTCQGCLYQACATQLAACDADCVAIQACLDTHCLTLTANSSPDAPTCTAWCEGMHPAGKAKYAALASCVQGAPCSPPCEGYPYDYNDCANALNAAGGPCYGAYQPCSGASGPCIAYTGCIGGCTSWAACQQCATQNPMGAMLDDAYQSCVESTCFVVAALPAM